MAFVRVHIPTRAKNLHGRRIIHSWQGTVVHFKKTFPVWWIVMPNLAIRNEHVQKFAASHMCRVLQIKSLRLCPVSHNFLQICPQLLGVILFADGVLPCVRLFFLEKLVILAIYYEIVVLKFFLLMFLPVSVDHK